MTKRYTVEFNAKVTPVKPLNDEFTLCKCYVMALDKTGIYPLLVRTPPMQLFLLFLTSPSLDICT